MSAQAPTELAVGNLIIVTESLAKLIAEEQDLLERRRPRDIGPLLEEKHRLTRAYARESAALKADPEWRRKVAPADVVRLTRSTARCRELTATHERRLAAMKQVSEGLLKSIGEAVARKRAPAQGYNHKAGLYAAGTRPGATPGAVSIALNQRV